MPSEMRVTVVAIALILAACSPPPTARSSPSVTAAPGASSPSSSVIHTSCVPAGTGYASSARTSTPRPVTTPPPVPAGAGAITGKVAYPSSGIVAQLVYAVNTLGAAKGAYSVETVQQQSTFTLLAVAPGSYFVYSAVRPVLLRGDCRSAFGAAFTRAVVCGLDVHCTDHRPVAVKVQAGSTTSGVDVFDWYVPAGSQFPPAPPPGIVPDARWKIPNLGSFATAIQAIEDSAPGSLKAELVRGSRSGCPVNLACLTLSSVISGSNAAYVIGQVGSNRDVLQCTLLAFRDAKGWHGNINWFCRPDRGFPALGQRGRVNIGVGAQPSACVNVRAEPGLSGRVVGCVRQGTAVIVDGGPAYVAPRSFKDSPDGFWWHIRGRGWVAYEYLRRSP